MAYVTFRWQGSGDPGRVSYGRRAGGGYRYVFRHGIGPGTMPEDAGIISGADISNGLTVLWLDRVLSDAELGRYDIPPETLNGRYLDGVEGL